MWTSKNCGRYDRSRLRYPSNLTDEEWALVEPVIPPAKRGGNRRHVVVRDVVNGLMYILSIPCLLACILARRIDRKPPFSALLILWLSMIAAVRACLARGGLRQRA